MSLFSLGNLRMAMMEKVKVVMERVVMEKVVTRMKRIRFAIE